MWKLSIVWKKKKQWFSLHQFQDHKLLSCRIMWYQPFKAFFLSLFLKSPVPIEFDVRLSGKLVSVLFFSLTEAVGWQRLSWWWQLNDLFFIKHLLLSLYRSLTTSLPPRLQCLFLSFDWLRSLSSSISHSSESLSPSLQFFSPSWLVTSHTVSSPGFSIVSVSLLVVSLFFFKREEGIHFHPSPVAIS